MRAKAVRFASPYPSEYDDALRRFMAANAKEVHNPWPELVDLDRPEYAWTNPLVRATYIPTGDPMRLMDLIKEDELPLELYLLLLHEGFHQVLDFTPAKELLRLHLAAAFYHVGYLLALEDDASDEQISGAWQELVQRSSAMAAGVEAVEIAEELVVTALSFHAIGHKYPKRHATISRLEKQWQARHSPAFRQLYPTFKKIVMLWDFHPDSGVTFRSALAHLGSFLQPIRIEDGHAWVLESKKRCEQMAECARAMEQGRSLTAWLKSQTTRDEMKAWEMILAESGRWQKGSEHQIKGALWALARGRGLEDNVDSTKRARKTRQWYLKWPDNPFDTDIGWISTILAPQEVEGRWYVTRTAPLTWTTHNVILYLEGLRQQLVQGKGIRCPLLDFPYIKIVGVNCHCEPDRKEGVQRLARWAAEGKFGKGDWTYLPYPCGQE